MVHHRFDPSFDPRFDPSFDPSFDPRFELIQEAEKSTQSLGLGLGLPIPYTDLWPQIQLREEIRGDERWWNWQTTVNWRKNPGSLRWFLSLVYIQEKSTALCGTRKQRNLSEAGL